jgi:hypothetical protein
MLSSTQMSPAAVVLHGCVLETVQAKQQTLYQQHRCGMQHVWLILDYGLPEVGVLSAWQHLKPATFSRRWA